jgi:hypothetical protein
LLIGYLLALHLSMAVIPLSDGDSFSHFNAFPLFYCSPVSSFCPIHRVTLPQSSVMLRLKRSSNTYEAERVRQLILSSPKSAFSQKPARVLAGKGGKPGSHLGRRAWLCLWLQIMASWTGITAVTAYSPVLLHQAGYSTLKQNGLAGGLNTIGIIGTIISAQIVDKLGRRKCLIGGAFGLFAVNLIAASLYEGSRAHPAKAASFAPAAVTIQLGLRCHLGNRRFPHPN